MISKFKLLLVEDNKEDFESIKRYLIKDTADEYVIEHSETGKDAIYKMQNGMYDCVLLDYNLPDMTGISVIEEYKKCTSNLDYPVILITGYGSEEIAAQSIKIGATDYLSKDTLSGSLLSRSIKYSIMKKRSEKREIEEKRFVNVLLENIPTPVFYVDNSERFLGCNNSFERLTNVNREEIIGKKIDNIESEIITTIITHINKIEINNGEPEEISYLDDKGKQRYIFVYCSNYERKDEHLGGKIFSILDITEIRRYESALYEAKEKAVEHNRMKTEFLANISHELRTPLNSILGFSQIMLEHDFDINEMKSYVTTIYKSGNHLLKIINDLLDVARIETGNIKITEEHVQIRQMLYDIEEGFLEHVDDKNSSINIVVEDNVPEYIISDRTKLYQVLYNLIMNAIKFTENGYVKIKTKAIPINNLDSDSYYIMFSVEDDGIGISEDKKDDVFEAFYQIDGTLTRMHGGTGVGLSICKKYVEALGGRIWFESKVKEGTTFFFTINTKIAKNVLQEEIINRKGLKDVKIKEKKVVLVEDDTYTVKFMELLLKRMGLKVFTANNGKKGIELVEKHFPDLILMDLQMPIMDGFEAVKLIRKKKQFEKIPIIALTAFVEEADKREAIEAGCDDHIPKPVSVTDFKQSIKKYLGL